MRENQLELVVAEEPPEENTSLPKILPPEYKGFWKEQFPAEEYHSIKGAVSSSGIRKILKSAAYFRASWMSEIDEPVSDAMHFGTLAHVAILEPQRFLESYRMIPEFTGLTKDGRPSTRSKAATDAREAWFNDLPKGTLAVSQEEYITLKGMVEAIIEHPDARASLKNVKTEISGFYRDAETGILCRIRPDALRFDATRLIDIKTTRDCSAEVFAREILNRGYHIQLAMYCAGIEAITGVKVKRPAIVAVEKKPPYEVAVYGLDDAAMDLGTAMYRRGLRRLKQCLDTGKWPKYQEEAQLLSLPGYAFYDDTLANDEENV